MPRAQKTTQPCPCPPARAPTLPGPLPTGRFREHVKREMQTHGIGVTELAMRADTHQPTLSRWLNHPKRRIRDDLLERVLAGLETAKNHRAGQQQKTRAD